MEDKTYNLVYKYWANIFENSAGTSPAKTAIKEERKIIKSEFIASGFPSKKATEMAQNAMIKPYVYFQYFWEELQTYNFCTHTSKIKVACDNGFADIPYTGKNDGFISTSNTNGALVAYSAQHKNKSLLMLNTYINGKPFFKHLAEKTDIAKQILKDAKTTITAEEITDFIKTHRMNTKEGLHCPQVYFRKSENGKTDGENYDSIILMPNIQVACSTSEIIKNIRSNYFADKTAPRFHPKAIYKKGFNKGRNIVNNFARETFSLVCMPKNFENNYIKNPRFNFFKESIYIPKEMKNNLSSYLEANVFSTKKIAIKLIKKIIYEIVLPARYEIMNRHDSAWSTDKKYIELDYQAIWLDTKYDDIRMSQTNREWMKKCGQDFAWSLGKFSIQQRKFIEKVFVKTIWKERY